MFLNQFLKKIYNSAKRNTYNHLVFLFKTGRKIKISENQKYAIINLDDRIMNYDMGRYGYIICQYFSFAGFNNIVKTNNIYFKNLSKYKKPLLCKKHAFIRDSNTPINSIVLNDPKKIIYLNYGYDILQKKNFNCIAPYPLHPLFYKSNPSSKFISSFRNENRKIKIFFAGNSNPKLYRGIELEKKFNIISRYNILKFVKDKYENTGFLKVINDNRVLNKLFLNNEDLNTVIFCESKITRVSWLNTLSKSNFFLCPPGMNMPWCHNLIESMAVGTIPILQYNRLMNPELEHMKNCLVFSCYEELYEVIKVALEMDKESIMTMSKNVVHYYDQYLSIENILMRINKFYNSNTSSLDIAIPFI